jgi:hypothetical protein
MGVNGSRVWLHSLGSNGSTHLEAVTLCLNKSGLVTPTLLPDKIRGPGIVLITEVNPEICEFIRVAAKNGTERIMALATHATAVAGGDAWRILQAGASDLLVWDE